MNEILFLVTILLPILLIIAFILFVMPYFWREIELKPEYQISGKRNTPFPHNIIIRIIKFLVKIGILKYSDK